MCSRILEQLEVKEFSAKVLGAFLIKSKNVGGHSLVVTHQMPAMNMLH